jgi:hypothetical protein
MSGHWDIWRTTADGVLEAEACGMRLRVRWAEDGGPGTHFAVLRCDGGPGVVPGSGGAEDSRPAMKAARELARRIAGAERPAPPPVA